MRSAESALVDIVREFLLAHHQMRRLFAHRRSGELGWDEVERLVGDDESSVLFRLKERSHALFRAGPELEGDLARVALFDLAVGSLFHEAMKLRENFYQLAAYAPKVAAARSQVAPGSEALFGEFERILAASSARLDEALAETESLLEQTRRQFRVLLSDRRESGLVARYLIENASHAEAVLEETLDDFFTALHGSASPGYALAARSYLDSGFFEEAKRALTEALARAPERADLRRTLAYAEGMSAYLRGRYDDALQQLSRWVDAEPGPDDARLAELAHAVVSRVGQLVEEGEERRALAERAGALARRLAPPP